MFLLLDLQCSDIISESLNAYFKIFFLSQQLGRCPVTIDIYALVMWHVQRKLQMDFQVCRAINEAIKLALILQVRAW
jgi:hypothetical protein